jgi:hypothetical protein
MEKDEKHQMFISLQPSDSRRSGAPKWTILELSSSILCQA